MNLPKQKRQRGVIPTPEGLRKLQAAILELEREEAFESRFTQEKISLYTGLAIRTIRKVFNREGMVSLSTLTSLFSAFKLELHPCDYVKPNLEDLEAVEDDSPPPLKSGKMPNLHSLVPSLSHQDWGEAIDVSIFHGRQVELEHLQQWIVNDRSRLIALLGIGGIGKTALSVKLAQQLQGDFDFLIWRSLRNAPPLETLLGELMQFLSQQQENHGDLRRLMHYLRSSRCLLVLDNVETILQSQQTAGQYQKGYEGYGELFNLIGETAHQSCLVLTSREKPKEIAALEGSWVRSLTLSGCPEAAQALLETRELSGTIAQKQQLAERYGNSPLAVKIVVTSIKDLFDGNISQFLDQNTPIFNSIRHLLSQQFDRLTPLEQTLMYWLAIDREWTSIPELAEDIIPPISRIELLEALESLSWRSLIEKQAGRYTQQPVVMEYITERLLERTTNEITQLIQSQEALTSVNFLKSHALLKAQVPDTIGQIQTRSLLKPLIQELLRVFGTKDNLKTQLKSIQSTIKHQSTSESTYLVGNVLNLLIYLQTDLRHVDLSGLTIAQADFRNVNLQGVDLSKSNLAKSVFTRTFGTVYALAFSPDNQLLATGHADGEIRLWQLATGQLIFTNKGHASSVWTLDFSPDGRTLASGSYDRTIKLWDMQTGSKYQTLYGHEDWVREIAFSPNGLFLASCSNDQTVKIWDIQTGRERQTLSAHTALVTTLCFHPQGQLLVSGSEDRSLRLWDLETGECLQILRGHTSSVSSVAFSADGRTLASSEEHSREKRAIKLWKVETGECYQTLEDDLTLVLSVAFSPDGQLLAGSDGQTLRLWDIETGKCCQILSGYTSDVWSLAFSPDGEMLAGSDDESIGVWDVGTGERLRTWQGYQDSLESYWSLVFSPPDVTGKMPVLASGSNDGIVRLWDVRTGDNLHILSQHTGPVRSLAFSPDDQILASGGEDGNIWLWDRHKGIALSSLHYHKDKVWSLAFSPLDVTSKMPMLLASGSADRTIALWEVNSGHCWRVLAGHEERVLSVAFSPDGTMVASGSADRTIKLWSVRTGQCIQTLSGHQGWICCLAFDPSGKFLASGSEDRTIKLWDVQTGECLSTLQGHDLLVWSVVFSEDSQQRSQLISGSADLTARIWDLSSGRCLKTFEGNTDLLWAFYYPSQGQILVSGSQGESINIWELQTGNALITLKSPRPYEGMRLTDADGLTEATLMDLQTLGAIV